MALKQKKKNVEIKIVWLKYQNQTQTAVIAMGTLYWNSEYRSFLCGIYQIFFHWSFKYIVFEWFHHLSLQEKGENQEKREIWKAKTKWKIKRLKDRQTDTHKDRQ